MYVLVFVAIACVYAGYAWYTYKRRPENFEDAEDAATAVAAPVAAAAAKKNPDPPADAGAADETMKSRKYVMRIFDVVLHRKPTDAEIDKYAALGDESAIVSAIVRDQDSAPAVPPAPASPTVEKLAPPEASPSSSVEYHEFGADDSPPHHSPGGKVCLDRGDLLSRLDTIRKEVLQFADMVRMM
jgi:hypothetical protein